MVMSGRNVGRDRFVGFCASERQLILTASYLIILITFLFSKCKLFKRLLVAFSHHYSFDKKSDIFLRKYQKKNSQSLSRFILRNANSSVERESEKHDVL